MQPVPGNARCKLFSSAEIAHHRLVAVQVDMRSILHKLALLYVASRGDLRAARDTGKVAHRLIAQHAKRNDGDHLPRWDLRGAVDNGHPMADTSSSCLYHYFANTIMQMQKQAASVAHQTLPPWLRSALQEKASLSSTDPDIDSAQLHRWLPCGTVDI